MSGAASWAVGDTASRRGAVLEVESLRKLIVFVKEYIYFYRIKVSKKTFHLIFEKGSLAVTGCVGASVPR